MPENVTVSGLTAELGYVMDQRTCWALTSI